MWVMGGCVICKVGGRKKAGRKSCNSKEFVAFRDSVGGLWANVTEADRMQLRPTGCSKCRLKPGCTRSCFLARGFVGVKHRLSEQSLLGEIKF